MGSLLSAAPSSAFLCWSKWGSRIDTATANGALTLCLQGLCGSLEDSSLKSKTWVKWLCSKTRDTCPMVQCHLQLPLVPYFLSLCVSILLSLLKHFHFRFSIWCNSRGWVFLSFFWYMKLPLNRRMSAELQYRTCMATWGLNIARPQVRSQVALLFRKEKWGDEKPSQADVLVFSSDITFFLHMWSQENQHHHHWCQWVERAPGTFGAGVPQPLLMCQQSPQWDRQSTTPHRARLARSKLKGTGYSRLQL